MSVFFKPIKVAKANAIALLLAFFASNSSFAASADHFVTTWKTNNPGTSNSTSIMVPMVGGPYDVDWNNDGVFDQFGLSGPVTHDFGLAGARTIRIRGSYSSIFFDNDDDCRKIIALNQWGSNTWASMAGAFHGAENMLVPATDTPDFSAVTDMSYMFTFAALANPATSVWNTGSVTNMFAMFAGAAAANPDVSGWDTSSVMNMAGMFAGAIAANPDVSNWNTGSVTTLSAMFVNANMAKPNVSGWNTSSVTDMSGMFELAPIANPDVSGWNTASVTDMTSMFEAAVKANPDVSGWNTGSVTIISYMFDSAVLANPDVTGWDTSNLITADHAFANSRFNRDIGSWNISSLQSAFGMFYSTMLSTANYDNLLIGWNAQPVQNSVNFDGGDSSYCSQQAINARANLISSYSWTITDVGQSCQPAQTCNLTMVPGSTVGGNKSYEACEKIVVNSGFTAQDGATLNFSSGEEVGFMPDVAIKKGATVEVKICGQSLCDFSQSPMPDGCHSCVTAICAEDPLCCSDSWDVQCVHKIPETCGIVCD